MIMGFSYELLAAECGSMQTLNDYNVLDCCYAKKRVVVPINSAKCVFKLKHSNVQYIVNIYLKVRNDRRNKYRRVIKCTIPRRTFSIILLCCFLFLPIMY